MLVSIPLLVLYIVLSAVLCSALDRFVTSRFPADPFFKLLPWLLCFFLASLLARFIFF